MKQQKLEQLRDIIARLEEIVEQSQLQSPEFQFQLYPTFSPLSMDSNSEKSSNIIEEQATQEQTKNEMQRLSIDTNLTQLDYTQISNELKKMLCNDYQHLNMDYIAIISENISKLSETPYTIIIQNQLNLVKSAIQGYQICNQTISKLKNISTVQLKENHFRLLKNTCDIRQEFTLAISPHIIDEKILKPSEIAAFTLISEQQQNIRYTRKMIEELINQFL